MNGYHHTYSNANSGHVRRVWPSLSSILLLWRTKSSTFIFKTLLIMCALWLFYRTLFSRIVLDFKQQVNINISSSQKGIAFDIPSIPRSKADIHIIFSTSCSPYQNWQVTRCRPKSQLSYFYNTASDLDDYDHFFFSTQSILLFHSLKKVHFTKDYSLKKSSDQNGNVEFFSYSNKPNSVKDFFENASPPITESVVALLDPDMVLLTPISPIMHTSIGLKRYDDFDNLNSKEENGAIWVKEGQPVSQVYGIGKKWVLFKTLKNIVPSYNSPALLVDEDDASKHYAAAPPYLLHTRDWVKVAKTWSEVMEGTYEEDKTILADMYAYSIAASHNKLPNILVNQWMLSNPKYASKNSNSGELWSPVDETNRHEICPWTGQVGAYEWSKRKIKQFETIFACDIATTFLLKEPGNHIIDQRVVYELHYGINVVLVKDKSRERGVRVKELNEEQAKRQSFMLCALHSIFNSALMDYWEHMCTKEQIQTAKQNIQMISDLPKSVLNDEAWLTSIGASI